MRPDHLSTTIAADRHAGALPLCVVATAGTVNTGAIDPIDDIADVCATGDTWLHVDGAYGAFGRLDPDVASEYRGIERADSVAVDPHKWLGVPMECGCALVRDGTGLEATFRVSPPYLDLDRQRGFGGERWFSDRGFQLSRSFRALKVWSVIASRGRDAIAAAIQDNNRMAAHLAAIALAAPDLELMAPRQLSIVCFRYLPRRGPPSAGLDDLNRRIVEDLQSGGEVFIAGTQLRPGFALRACIIHPETTSDDVEALVDAVRAAGQRLAGS